MVLGVDELLRRVKEEKLVSNLSERELTNPEGCGFDLRIGKVYRFTSSGYLGVDERKTSDVELAAEYAEGKTTVFELQPGESVLTVTMESVKMPQDMTALIQPRSTLYRSGVIMRGGNVSPGYEGTLGELLYNPSKHTFNIEMGARFIHILFFEVRGKTNLYRGQWKGGRVAATKLEKQV